MACEETDAATAVALRRVCRMRGVFPILRSVLRVCAPPLFLTLRLPRMNASRRLAGGCRRGPQGPRGRTSNGRGYKGDGRKLVGTSLEGDVRGDGTGDVRGDGNPF